jgi:hypothetical protein
MVCRRCLACGDGLNAFEPIFPCPRTSFVSMALLSCPLGLKPWNAHRQQWMSASLSPSPIHVSSSPSASQKSQQQPHFIYENNTLGAPTILPTKRRRPKRTEGERIAYLRSNPYVTRLEAFRIFCGSCCKWIPLRSVAHSFNSCNVFQCKSIGQKQRTPTPVGMHT